ncbi:MAG: serine hydroxymethyltransferase [Christensenellales bacterium]|jgi:glycine hydroxymethyltransferase
MIDLNVIAQVDPEISKAMKDELTRQREHIELIASENFVSPAVLAATGSHLTNKYAEGYPGKRYYGGCEYIDVIESLAIDRAKAIFGADHANVQPHSGSQANYGVYNALVEPGDTVLGMSLAHGGHLTHGSPVNFSGKLFHIVSYGVDEVTHRIDYDNVRKIALEARPKMIVCGASAYPRIIDFEALRAIADEVDAVLVADIAHIAGLVASGDHPSPVPYAQIVTTTTHKTLRGPRGGLVLCMADYAKVIDKSFFPGIQGGPLEHVIAAKAVCFKEAMTPGFKEYQHQIVKNAKAMADQFISNGVRLVSGGTDNHMMLLDLTPQGRTGRDTEKLLHAANITTNKNAIPFDPLKPMVTSGIRIGTPAMTTRGMKEREMRLIADCVSKVIIEGETTVESVKQTVLDLCARFPLYEDIVSE